MEVVQVEATEKKITETDDKLIASAAINGLRRTPAIGYRMPAAIGMPSALYPNAKNKF